MLPADPQDRSPQARAEIRRVEVQETMPLPYAFGTVLAGYLMVIPFWAPGALWNRWQPERSVNPWILPSLAYLLLAFCFALNASTGKVHDNDPVVIVGLIPAALGCWASGLRWRRGPESERLRP